MTSENTAGEGKHPIQVAARRSGLTPDVIRAWERRYSAVTPQRSGTGRRLYSDDDVDRLLLLSQATRAGRRIGDVAGLDAAALRELVDSDRRAAVRAVDPAGESIGRGESAEHLAEALRAVERLDGTALESVLRSASVDLSAPVLGEQVLMPLMKQVGDRWRDGSMRIAHEHLTTAVVRSFLGRQTPNSAVGATAPEIVIATPAGQRHELGALMVALAAASDGWKVTYLGPDLPGEEVATVIKRRRPQAVAMSIVFPSDDPGVARDLRLVGGEIGNATGFFVGGAAAPAYAGAIEQAGGELLSEIDEVRARLRELRDGPRIDA